MALSTGLLGILGEPTGANRDSSESLEVLTTSLLSQTVLGLLPETPGAIRRSISQPPLRKQTQGMISTRKMALTPRAPLWIASFLKRGIWVAHLLLRQLSFMERSALQSWLGRNSAPPHSPPTGTGEMLVAQTIYHGQETNTSLSIAGRAGLKAPHQLLLTDSTLCLKIITPHLLT